MGAIGLAFHQQATAELGSDDLGEAGEEGLRERLGERGGYGSGFAKVLRDNDGHFELDWFSWTGPIVNL